jgi:hypothetical protein
MKSSYPATCLVPMISDEIAWGSDLAGAAAGGYSGAFQSSGLGGSVCRS